MTEINTVPPLSTVTEEDDALNTSQIPLIPHEPNAGGDVNSDDCHQPPPDTTDQSSTDRHSTFAIQVKEDLNKMRELDAQSTVQY